LSPGLRRVAIAFAIYCAIMFGLQWYRWQIWTFGTDLGTFSQAILDTFGGFRDGPEQGTHLRFHWTPLMGSLYPFLLIAHSALVLEIAQFVLIGLAAFPLYGLVRRYADDGIASFCGILPLVYPPLAAVAFLEFHEIAFYPAIAIALIWAADNDRWGSFAVLALLGALVREEVCITFALAGAGLAALTLRPLSAPRGLLHLEPRAPRALAIAGAWLCVVNAGALAFYFYDVIPRIGAWAPSHFYTYPFATGPVQVIGAILTHPAYASAILTPGRLTYLLEAFAPLAFLPFGSAWTLFALPGFAEILLSSNGITWRMGSHYAAIWIPWLLIATSAVIVRAQERSPGLSLRLMRTVSVTIAVFLIFFNPLHPVHYLRPIYPHDHVEELAALVPRNASLITHDEWFTHIAIDYPLATVFEYAPHEYALYADDYPSAYYRDVEHPALRAAIAAGKATEIRRIGAVALYRLNPPAP
jgi:uncharacterized membrane protein